MGRKSLPLLAMLIVVVLCLWPSKPKVLIIGDSISLGYAPFVVAQLKDFDVRHSSENAETTRNGIERLANWLRGGPWSMIVFNFGLHDMNARVSPEQHADNLRQIVRRLKKTGARLMFVSTTPVPVTIVSYGPEQMVGYRNAARAVMAEARIPVLELPEAEQKVGDVHFTAHGYATLADAVAAGIRSVGATAR